MVWSDRTALHRKETAGQEVVWSDRKWYGSDRTALLKKQRAEQEVVWNDRKWCGVTGQPLHRK